ncbi:alpha/beta hydrolase [Paraburkholderia caballeronis]|uniref:alpha/beta hydrolase n=1 Tax=Paraburkholderia caballeronis TaxID=416943 RepID=UPI0010646F87|nr:alpha/beta hydrolase [Paraburkholderia caballeronis]TDV16487.1 pimeloyl-ACP methyl ester carboxylesterase [Paraburkholderia caballeronis]TDV18883.1 pimeloyl-ACP methyl ester carboxylesterase [Paraburkholderia caballeronis]TDV27016.1 pimeloyl-ACP methyl ester carboxylesterase [Paraburkholderia caballeronis]
MKSPLIRLAAAFAFAFASLGAHAATATTPTAAAAPVKNVVLVHGFFADGSGWQAVSKILTRDGYKVSVVQEPETSFDDDVKATRRVIDAQDGPSILVGHSYGGAVVTEAGNDAKVAGLVYVAAFQPDTGESPLDLTKKMPPATKAIKATADGYLYFDPAQFRADFAADVPAAEAQFMAASQVMPAAQSFGVPITQAAWRTKPSWAVVATADRAINPDLERFMTKRAGSTTVEIPSSHAAYISHPVEVAKLIEQAARHAGAQ